MVTNPKLSIYDKILTHYVKDARGCLMVVSHDALFLKALKGAFKSLGLDYKSVFNKHTLDEAISDSKLLLKRYNQIIFFVEAAIDGFSNVLTLRNINSIFGHQCKVIVITAETEKSKIIQMYEMGADNVIVKPVSINSLIQKVALTLNPNNKLAKMVDEAKALIQENSLNEAKK
ncbi:MAG: response regulator, partial [Desulfovibrionales bacterium]|nr:response regulator [Desulfovibrionales bacterium]